MTVQSAKNLSGEQAMVRMIELFVQFYNPTFYYSARQAFSSTAQECQQQLLQQQFQKL